jgi:tetratricopeptide (TPR) repeat protein
MTEAADNYAKIAPVPRLGPRFSALGLADVAIYQGRFSEAVRILEDAAAADIAAKSNDPAASKLMAQAYAYLQRGQKPQAVASAAKALQLSQLVKIRFLAARIYVEAGQTAKAKPLMEGLAAEVQKEPQAYGKNIEALMAIHSSDARPAISLLLDANKLFDTWIGQFDLGRAYLANKQYVQADAVFDLCLNKRKGEALSLFLDEEPTFGYLPPVLYYRGLTKDGMGSGAEQFKAYLAIRGNATEDPLVAEVKKRIK